MMIKLIIAYYIIMNVVAFGAFFIDKKKAENNGWRIKEKTLLTLCFLGGAFGGFGASRTFRHKTQDPAFKSTLPMSAIIHAIVLPLLLIFL